MSETETTIENQDAESAETPENNQTETIADAPAENLPGAATWPEDWRQQFAGDDESGLKTLGRFKTPDGVYKAYNSLRQKMSSGEYTRARPEGDDPEALKAWREEVGVPETPEGYLEKLPEGFEVPGEDQPLVDKYLERMHAEGADTKHVHEGLKWYYETQQAAAEERAIEDKKYRAESEDALRSDWGQEYRGNINGMRAMLKQFAGEDLMQEILTARTDDGKLVGDNPGFLKMMVELSSEINPMGVLTPSGGEDRGANIQTRKAEIEAMMHDTKGRNDPNGYWQSPAIQEEYRRLLELEDKYKAA